jgi:hypothetical protein
LIWTTKQKQIWSLLDAGLRPMELAEIRQLSAFAQMNVSKAAEPPEMKSGAPSVS